jgi:hypothetical protein
MAVFEAMQPLNLLKNLCSQRMCRFITSKWRFLKRYNHFIDLKIFVAKDCVASLLQNGGL